ncbi:allophycocyanin subunit alpha-B [Thermocoleostomius sinensis]|jgi:allophycocyanin-B|uniref:Allophycocyanin subunit alpha-B n=1 Tax=Thermocoleostomius sinensis A174 TaxID=2016057 RepID=A0A9E9C9M3_9CYAN|nr:allophycocyanin subunit alpha-B [Thermocoleostomius sinensis]WAL59777.1 allophycocyanin subunit alpha-B [Thermocoleostomius sinensis A174]
MSIITRSIAAADREARYLSAGELDAIRDFFEEGPHRLRIAATLTANEHYIVERGSQRFWERCPVTPSNSGNPTYRASCMRDQSWYIRLITYALVVGDIDPIEKTGIKGAKEMYISLGIPLRNIVECMRCLKEIALDLLTPDEAIEVAPYFDYLIQGLMP